MSNSALALAILLPFGTMFAYAARHEWYRVHKDGPGTYGLAYDPETERAEATAEDTKG